MSLQSHIEIHPYMLPLTKRCPHSFTNSKFVCVFLSRKIYQSSAIRQICSGSLLSNNHPVVEPVAVETEKIVKLDHLPNIPRGGVTHIAKKKCLKTTAQLSCAKLVRRDGQCSPVLHENRVWYPETIWNKNKILYFTFKRNCVFQAKSFTLFRC